MTDNPFLRPRSEPAVPTSRFLTETDFASLYAAAEFASEFDMCFDTTVSFAWRLMGADTPEKVGKAFAAFTKCLRDWLDHRSLPAAWVYAHECGRRVGLHTHIILYLPGAPSRHRKDFRDWAKRWVIGQVGGRAPRALRVRGPYKETPWLHWRTLSYLMKGYDRTAIVQSAREAPDKRDVLLGDLIACEWKDPGPIAMKQRVGVSQSLGPARRSLGVPGGFDYLITGRRDVPAHLSGIPEYCRYPPPSPFVSKYDDGVRDVRRLYPNAFYEKVTGLYSPQISEDDPGSPLAVATSRAEVQFQPDVPYENPWA